MLEFVKNETNTFFFFAKYVLSTLDEGLYSWIVDRGVNKLRTSILIQKFIIPQISYSILIKI